MKNRKYLVTLVILLVLNGILLYKVSVYSRAVSDLIPMIENSKRELLSLESNFIIEKSNENLMLDRNIELIDINGNTFFANELFKNNAIVLRYSELQCDLCINAQIKVLLNNKDKIKGDVFLIAYYKNGRDMFISYKNFLDNGIENIKMFLLPDNNLRFPMDKLDTPYYFCINSDLTMTNFFIPNKDKPQLSESYLISTSKNFGAKNIAE